MDAPEPLVRARHLKDWLERVAREEDPWRARFFEALPAATRTTIESAVRGTWLPMRFHVELADIMEVAYGPARAHQHYRRSFGESLHSGIFGPLLRTGTRLFGATPGTFLRWAHRGWDASFRNAGQLRGEVLGPGVGRLLYSGLPPVCTASDPWLDSAQGSAYGVLDVLGIPGVIRLDRSRKSEGLMELNIEWSERSI